MEASRQLEPIVEDQEECQRANKSELVGVPAVRLALNTLTGAKQAENADPSRPFVLIEEAKASHPDVFRARYDADEDRLVLREMVKKHKDDIGIMSRVDRMYRNPNAPVLNALQIHEDPYFDLLTRSSRYRILKREEEVELFNNMKLGVAAFKERAKTDDPDPLLEGLIKEGVFSHQALFLLNIRLAVAPTQKYLFRYKHIEKADGLQYGLLGIQHAIEKFDESKGYKFSTYATWWIKESVDRLTSNHSRVIRLPINVEQKGRRLFGRQQEFERQVGRDLSREERFELSEMNQDEFNLFENFGPYSMTSLNKKIAEDSDLEMGNLIEDPQANTDDIIDDISAKQELDGLLNEAELTDQEKLIISIINRVQLPEFEGTVCQDGRSYEQVFDAVVGTGNRNDYREVGQALGLSHIQVMRIEERAFENIRLANSSVAKAR